MLPTALTETAAQALQGHPGVRPSLRATLAPSPPAMGIRVLGGRMPDPRQGVSARPRSRRRDRETWPESFDHPLSRAAVPAGSSLVSCPWPWPVTHKNGFRAQNRHVPRGAPGL